VAKAKNRVYLARRADIATPYDVKDSWHTKNPEGGRAFKENGRVDMSQVSQKIKQSGAGAGNSSTFRGSSLQNLHEETAQPLEVAASPG
jgi:hypothetical protein